MAALYALPLADAAGPAAKRRRITSKRPDDAFRAEFGAAAVADELAHGEGAFLPVGVKRKLVHWTHGRSSVKEHVQPDAMTRKEFEEHLARCYKETYPRPSSPTGSIYAFSCTAQEMYSYTPPGACPNHKHTATYCTEQHYWNKVAEHSLSKYKVKMNAVAHTSYAAMYQYIREPSTKKPLHKLDAEPFLSKFHPKDEALSELLAASRSGVVFV